MFPIIYPYYPYPYEVCFKSRKSKMERAFHTFIALQPGHRKPTVIESLCLIIIPASGLIAPLFCRSFNIVPSQTGNKEPRQLKLMAVFNSMILPPRYVAAPRERVRSSSVRRSPSLPCFPYFMMRHIYCPVCSYFVKDDYFPFCFMSLC